MAPHSNEGGDQWVKVTPRRRFIRYRTDLPLSVLDPFEREFAGQCDVISEGGMGGTVVSQISLGSVVRLRFLIPTHSAHLDILGVVRYQQDCRHGFAFVSLPDSEQAAIRQFCSDLTIYSETGHVDP